MLSDLYRWQLVSGQRPAAREPNLGPHTGQFDASLVVLGRIADRQAAEKVTQSFPVYTGPATGEMASVTVMTAREAAALRRGSRHRAAAQESG